MTDEDRVPDLRGLARTLTAEEVRRGLFPETLDDLKYRPICFAAIAAGDAEHRKKHAKKKR